MDIIKTTITGMIVVALSIGMARPESQIMADEQGMDEGKAAEDQPHDQDNQASQMDLLDERVEPSQG